MTFVAGSTVTGVLSLCNLADYELSKYKEMLDKLADISVNIEEVLDDFPPGADQRNNDRYSRARRERDLTQEEEHYLLIERLLSRHQEHRSRLDDLESEAEEVPDDAVEVVDDGEEVGLGQDQQYGFTSATQSHYTFQQFQRQQDEAGTGAAAPENEEGDFQDAFDLDMQALGLGLGLQNLEQAADRLAQQGRSVSPPRVDVEDGRQRIPPLSPRVQILVTPPRPATTTARTPTPAGKLPSPSRTPPRQQKPAGPEISVAVTIPTGDSFTEHTSAKVVATSSAGVTSHGQVYTSKSPLEIPTHQQVHMNSSTSTTTTVSTRTTPSTGMSTGAGIGPGVQRRRASTEGTSSLTRKAGQESREDELSRLKLLVSSRTQQVSQGLVVLLTRLQASFGR